MSQMKWIFLALVSLSSALQAAPQDQPQAPQIPAPMNMMDRQAPMQSRNQEPAATDQMTIVDIATSDPSFSTLAKALAAADLISTLQGEGPFTLFAPNDKAFAKLSPNKLADLMKPENKDKLAAILTYHVVPGKLMTDDLKTMKAKTINGKSLDIKVKNGEVTVNQAKVIKTDTVASNGVIQVIDTVLMP